MRPPHFDALGTIGACASSGTFGAAAEVRTVSASRFENLRQFVGNFQMAGAPVAPKAHRAGNPRGLRGIRRACAPLTPRRRTTPPPACVVWNSRNFL